MAKAYTNVNSTTGTFAGWLSKANELYYDMSTMIVTVADVAAPNSSNESRTTGNADIQGIFSANNIVVWDTLAGGRNEEWANTDTLYIVSNTQIGNSSQTDTLTVYGDATFDANVQIGSAATDGLTIAANTVVNGLSFFTANSRFNDNVLISFGTDSDTSLYHDGSDLKLIHNNANTSDFIIEDVSGNDVFTFTTDHSTFTVARYDDATDGPSIVLLDEGTTPDAANVGGIFFKGQDSGSAITEYAAIKGIAEDNTNTTEDGALLLYTTIGGTAKAMIAVNEASDTAVSLRFDGSEKLATKTDGVDITGELQSDSLDVDGVADISGVVTLGANANFGDDGQANFGDSADLQIFHDDSHSHIKDNGAGNLKISSSQIDFLGGADGAETMATMVYDGAVTLYHDNAVKIATLATGVVVTGDTGTDTLTVGGGYGSTGLAIAATGNIQTNGTLTVDGLATLNGGIAVDDNFTVNGTSGATVIGSTLTASGIIKTDDATEATNTTDGSLQTDGGLSVVKDIIAGNDIKLLSDAAGLHFGGDGDVNLTHVHDTGLLLNSSRVIQFRDSAINIGSPADGDLDINADDEIELNSTLIDVNGNLDVSGTIVGASTLSATTGTFSGILKTDDATEATNTTDGSLQTDGGLSVVKDAVFGDDVLLLSDAAVIKFGVNSDVTLTHVADAGLTLSVPATADNSFPTLTLAAGDNDIAANDVLGALNFVAPAEGAGTDAVAVAGSLRVISEGDFAADNNASKMSFMLGASEAATEKMSLSSTGVLATASLDISGDIDVDGTANLDAVDIDGAVNIAADVTIASTNKIIFNDASQFIQGASGTILDINATDEIELNATLLDVNANINASGTYTGAGTMTTGGNIVIPDAGTIGSASDADAISISSDEIELNSTLIDVNGNLDVSGTIVGVAATFSGLTSADGGIDVNTANFTVAAAGDTVIAANTESESSTTGALKVVGGTGIAGKLYVGDDVNVAGDLIVDGTATFAGGGQLTVNNSIVTTLSVTGDTDIGSGASDTVTINARVGSNIVPSTDSARDLGTDVLRWTHVYADNVHGIGTTLTALNASNIASGTIAAARLPATISSDTTGNAATVTNGVYLNTTQTISGAKTFSATTDFNGAVTLDGATTSSSSFTVDGGYVKLNDNINLNLGSNTDVEIYHDGTNLLTDINTGNFQIRDGADSNATRFTFTPSSSELEIKNTDAAAAGPTISLRHDTPVGSAAASDEAGQIFFQSDNVAGTKHNYAYIDSRIIDPTTDSEDGALSLYTIAAGTIRETIKADSGVATLLHLGSAKLATASDGVTITGTATATTFSGSGASLTNIPATSLTGDTGDIDDAILPDSISSDITGTAAKVTVTDSTTNTNFPVVFHNESNGLLDDTGALRYNPSTGTLLVPNLAVAGTTTQVDTVTMNANNAIVFEGATPDDFETTLTITDPTADRTISLPNATGTIALTSSDITGNAATATTLATARTIGGTSFNGSADIAVALAATATTLATARDIGGVSFNGSASINLPGVNTAGNQDTSGTAAVATVATTVTITDNESTNENNAIVFTAGGDVDGGNLGLESDGTLTYNPSTGKITATGFVGALTGDVTGDVSGSAATVTGAAQSNITSLGTLTTLTVDNIIINGTNIGHTSDTDAIAIASNGVVTFSQAPVFPDGSIAVADLDIDGATDIGAALVDDDLFIVDDGAGGTNRKSTMARIKTYINASASGSVNADDIDGGDAAVLLTTSSGNITIDAAANDSDIILKGTDGGVDTTFLTIDGSAAGKATFNNEIVSGAVITSGAGLVIADAGNIGSASDTDAISIASDGVVTFTQEIVAPSLDISGNVDIDGTLEADAITVNGATLAETISDTVGAMVGSNTETGITVAYQDADNTLDFVIGTLNQDTTGNAATVTNGVYTSRTLTAGTGLTGGGTLAADRTFAIDSTVTTLTGSQTLTNKTLTSPSIGTGFTFDGITITAVQTSGESFVDNNTSLMTSAAIDDRINAAAGVSALNDLSDAKTNSSGGTIGIGTDALANDDGTANLNTAIGYKAGEDVTDGVGNFFGGHSAGLNATTANNTIAIGRSAIGSGLLTGPDNTAIGYAAGLDLTSGYANIFMGYYTGSSATTGIDNVMIGRTAGYNATTATNTVAIGRSAIGSGVLTGTDNTAIGYQAGFNATTADYTVAIGYSAIGLGLLTGDDNIAIGRQAGYDLTTGHDNNFIGYNAGSNATEANYAIAIGREAIGAGEMTGSDNIAIGRQAGNDLTSGGNNVMMGLVAGTNVTTGSDNTILGPLAGDALTTGSNNIIIGKNAAASAVDVSNEITMGDTNVTKFRLPGAGFEITSGAVVATGDITAFGSISDIRLKENIEPITNALDKVSQIGGYTFAYKKNPDVRMTGVIAQEVEKVLPEVIYTTADINSGEENLAVRYENMIGLLVEAIKELKTEVEELKKGK